MVYPAGRHATLGRRHIQPCRACQALTSSTRPPAYNLLLLLAQQFANFIPPILVLPMLGRALDSGGLARLGLLLASGQIMALLSEYSLNQQALYRLSQQPPAQTQRTVILSHWVRRILGIRIRIVLVSLLIGLPVLHSYYQATALELLAVSLFAVCNLLSVDFLFLYQERLTGFTLWTIISRWTLVPLSALCLYWQPTAAAALLAMAASYLLTSSGALWLAHRSRLWHWSALSEPPDPSVPDRRQLLRNGWDYLFSQSAYQFFIVCIPLLAAAWLQAPAAGALVAADRVKNAAGYVAIAVTSLLGSRMAQAISPAAYRQQLRNSLRWHGLLGLAASLGLLLLSPWLIAILFGPAHQNAAQVLQYFSVLPLLMAVNQVVLRQRVLLECSAALMQRITVVAVASFFGLTAILGHYLGLTGHVLAVILTEIMLLAGALWVLRHSTGSPPHLPASRPPAVN